MRSVLGEAAAAAGAAADATRGAVVDANTACIFMVGSAAKNECTLSGEVNRKLRPDHEIELLA